MSGPNPTDATPTSPTGFPPPQLARPQYALVFGGYALLSLTIGTVLLHRRNSN